MTEVKVNINKEAVKMGETIEKGKNLLRFLYFLITMVVLVSRPNKLLIIGFRYCNEFSK